MKRIPTVSWNTEVLERLAWVHASLVERDERAKDLAPAMHELATRVTQAKEARLKAVKEERSQRAFLEQAETALHESVQTVEAWVLSVVNPHRASPVHKGLFPKSPSKLLASRRVTRFRDAQALADDVAKVPGLEAQAATLRAAVDAAKTAHDAWSQAAYARKQAAKALDAAKEALVKRYAKDLRALQERLDDPKAIDAFFPALPSRGVATAADAEPSTRVGSAAPETIPKPAAPSAGSLPGNGHPSGIVVPGVPATPVATAPAPQATDDRSKAA